MRRFIFGMALAGIVLAANPLAVADDAAITKQIAEQLREQQRLSNLKGFDIGIQVEDGTVTASGQVASAEQGRLALEIARRVPGVRMVVNDLHVGANRQGANRQGPARQGKGARAPRRPLTTALTGFAGGLKQQAAEHQSGSPKPLASLASSGRSVIGSGARNLPPQAMRARPTPARQTPLAFSPSTIGATLASANGAVPGDAMTEALPMPAHLPSGAPSGIARAAYDHPNMPGYAWPSYASHPNYAALTYPQQYSAAAWPYIGPFYPYPQVPLGWRKVMLEWDDGWWFLDFKAK